MQLIKKLILWCILFTLSTWTCTPKNSIYENETKVIETIYLSDSTNDELLILSIPIKGCNSCISSIRKAYTQEKLYAKKNLRVLLLFHNKAEKQYYLENNRVFEDSHTYFAYTGELQNSILNKGYPALIKINQLRIKDITLLNSKELQNGLSEIRNSD